MKIAQTKPTSTMTTRKPLLPLVPEVAIEELDKSNSVSYECRVNPADANSAKYKVSVRILTGSEDIRTLLTWMDNVERVVAGMNLDTHGPRTTMVRTMMRGTPQSLYDAGLRAAAQSALERAYSAAADDAARQAVEANGVDHYRHVDHHEPAIQHVVRGLIPVKALQRIKRFMRRECRKPVDMKVRTFYQHLVRMNLVELPKLPPFNAYNSLSTDELLDIILYGVPKSWVREMDRQGFDPMLNTLDTVITFLEQIESAEEAEGKRANTDNQSGNKKNNKSNKKAKGSSDNGKGQKYCSYHGKGNHSSDECNKLRNDPDAAKKKFGNKSWTKKADDAAKAEKKELAAFVKKAIAKGVRKELNSIDKKRKADSDDEFDLNALDAELKEFNYEDMQNLKIDSDEEGEVVDEVSV